MQFKSHYNKHDSLIFDVVIIYNKEVFEEVNSVSLIVVILLFVVFVFVFVLCGLKMNKQ
jgi:hypothetical protein